MTLDTKKQSLRNPERVLDERDPLWSSLDNLTAGMSAQERASYLMSAVKEMTKSGQASEQPFNPIDSAMKSHPTLTREEALEMARDLGY
jgi:hypothetical protein